MIDKKKSSVPKMNETRMNTPQASKNPRQDGRVSATAQSGAAVATQPLNTQKQLANFEAGMKLFHARKFKEARELFVLAGEGPERDVSHRARLHATICERRLQQPAVTFGTAEDHYNYAVALLNTRKTEEARAHLEKALEMAPDADHVYYALALAQAQAGDANGAHDHLKRAIELEPKNRIMARQDADFASLAGQPPFQALLYPEKKNW